MEAHYKFRTGEQKEFLLKIASQSNLSTKELAEFVNISARNYRDWIREKYAISGKAASYLSMHFNIVLPEPESILINRWQNYKIDNGRIGGNAYFRLYGSPATPEGRSKGGKKAIETLQKKGIFPMRNKFHFSNNYNLELAEFVGIMLGDGGITNDQCTITLNGEADADYIKYVLHLGKNIIGEQGGVYKDKHSKAKRIYYTGVNLVRYLKSIGLKVGNKVTLQVSVPSWVNDNIYYKIACLRGLVDTDGCLFIHKYKVNGKEYKYTNLGFANQSVPLIKFTHKTLLDLGFSAKTTSYLGKHRVWLYNRAEVQKYLRVVGSNNTRILKYKEGMPSG